MSVLRCETREGRVPVSVVGKRLKTVLKGTTNLTFYCPERKALAQWRIGNWGQGEPTTRGKYCHSLVERVRGVRKSGKGKKRRITILSFHTWLMQRLKRPGKTS